MEELISKLKEHGLNDEQIKKLTDQGFNSLDDLDGMKPEQLNEMAGCGFFTAKRVIKALAPAPAAPAASAAPAAESGAPASEVVPEGKAPTSAQLNGFAAQFGMDPSMVSMFMMSGMFANNGMDFDFGSMIPISQIVGSYSPKIRNMVYVFMGQIQKSVGDVPIVVINADGSVNAELTAKYVLTLQEGFPPAENDIFYEDGKAYQVLKVGVDAQSVYDADPLDSSRAVPNNNMGIGRINWKDVSLDVKQMVYLAVHETHELSSDNESQVARLRDHIKKETTRMDLQGDFPQAYTMYNEKARTGALPTLRIQLSRSARRPEFAPRRQRLGDRGGQPGPGSGFRGNDDEQH
jgi:hypothetical protein